MPLVTAIILFYNLMNAFTIESRRMNHMKILAITSCPNGIAHTYMAQEKLEQAAKDMGVHIKVETQGGVGAKMF